MLLCSMDRGAITIFRHFIAILVEDDAAQDRWRREWRNFDFMLLQQSDQLGIPDEHHLEAVLQLLLGFCK